MVQHKPSGAKPLVTPDTEQPMTLTMSLRYVEGWIRAGTCKGKRGSFWMTTNDGSKLENTPSTLYHNGLLAVHKLGLGRWGVSHVPTGRSLHSRSFSDRESAQKYVYCLRRVMDWNFIDADNPSLSKVSRLCLLLCRYCLGDLQLRDGGIIEVGTEIRLRLQKRKR